MIRAIITVYHPSQENLQNIKNISKQVDSTIICDNSPNYCNELKNLQNINYVWFGQNLGLSKAFNNVLQNKEFGWQDDDYVIFFDQDSNINDNYIESLLTEFEEVKRMDSNIGALGPVFFNNSNNTIEKPKLFKQVNQYSFKVKSIITSSMLTTYKILKEIDYWNEFVFLDMADWDLCWRLEQKNYNCYMTEIVTLNHTLGNGEKKIGPLRIRIGNPIREYYQTRDCLYLLHMSYVPIKYKVRFIAMVTIRPIEHLLFLKDKKERLKYIYLGIKDYRNKIYGEFKTYERNE